MMEIEKDLIFETAEKYVNETGLSIFLTGKAGTGKTTFLKYITNTTTKRFVILAPTGVAAINAGGVTIHSFFQLPLCPYLPEVKELITEYQMPQKSGLRKSRIKMIRTLDLLIIDEISMVRADLLDAVDMSLRRYRRNDKPFGGVQLLMIGDANQLSPVVKENEREYISRVYPSPYFFYSKALQKVPYITIELSKVHRQKDLHFLNILNSIRENRISREILNELNRRVGAFDESQCGDVIRLTTHNSQADRINTAKLQALGTKAFEWEAEIEGDFPENLYPVEKTLTLKVGAQVMFVRNDAQGQYYNGKIGTVQNIDNQGIVTVVDPEGQEIVVEQAEWPNLQYSLDKDSGEIRQDTAGVFRQLPLRIAWAITIHKSQGLTFDKVIINAGAAFAYGQVYVALSRCRSMEGISLDEPISPSVIYSDANIARFNRDIPQFEDVRARLDGEQLSYYFDNLRDIFSFERCCNLMGWVAKVFRTKLSSVYPDYIIKIDVSLAAIDAAAKVGETFRRQLSKIQDGYRGAESEEYLQQRLSKAVDYFLPTFIQARVLVQDISTLEIDNKENKKALKEACEECLPELQTECNAMEAIQKGNFSIEKYNRIRTDAYLAELPAKGKRKLKKVEKEEGESPSVNEDLRERLMKWRTERFKADNVPAYTIMHQSTLLEIAMLAPKTKEELLSIKGFGEAKFKKFGADILKICSEFM